MVHCLWLFTRAEIFENIFVVVEGKGLFFGFYGSLRLLLYFFLLLFTSSLFLNYFLERHFPFYHFLLFAFFRNLEKLMLSWLLLCYYFQTFNIDLFEVGVLGFLSGRGIAISMAATP